METLPRGLQVRAIGRTSGSWVRSSLPEHAVGGAHRRVEAPWQQRMVVQRRGAGTARNQSGAGARAAGRLPEGATISLHGRQDMSGAQKGQCVAGS